MLTASQRSPLVAGARVIAQSHVIQLVTGNNNHLVLAMMRHLGTINLFLTIQASTQVQLMKPEILTHPHSSDDLHTLNSEPQVVGLSYGSFPPSSPMFSGSL